jgi:hypothetical protein
MKPHDDNNSDGLTAVNFDRLPLMLNERDAARILNVSTAFLRLSRCKNRKEGRTEGPRFVRINGSVKYKTGELKKWVDSLPEKA